ncbi:MAG: dimethylarginine dimethylaminohydrolase family protein [Thermoanaerobaculia bacterium]
MLVAFTREVSPSLGRCELTHLPRQQIDVELAREQHRAYELCLATLGCEVRRLPPAPDLPDGVFVEDAAVVLDELAVIARPGAESRRAETASVAAVLGEHRTLSVIEAPGTLDGGDVLRVGNRLYVGLSTRTNRAGLTQLAEAVRPFGYEVRSVAVRACLHLKSAVTAVAADLVLLRRDWVDAAAFAELGLVDVAPSEPMAANALLVGETVIVPTAHERTRERLEHRGIRVRSLAVSELAKAEGGVTCCSLICRV